MWKDTAGSRNRTAKGKERTGCGHGIVWFLEPLGDLKYLSSMGRSAFSEQSLARAGESLSLSLFICRMGVTGTDVECPVLPLVHGEIPSHLSCFSFRTGTEMSYHDALTFRVCRAPPLDSRVVVGWGVYRYSGLLVGTLTSADGAVGLSILEASSALSPSCVPWGPLS